VPEGLSLSDLHDVIQEKYESWKECLPEDFYESGPHFLLARDGKDGMKGALRHRELSGKRFPQSFLPNI